MLGFDDQAKKLQEAFVKIMNKANVNFGVLGSEESSRRWYKKGWK